ncbi:MAG: bifunctional methylenetetrahydrofolate dehydrogenase/methenyltetrahydrofolate cyclohydrolase FolD [Armatimonadetes bacterium]|nr:bifunctional methylenetetrahydrofolate dehydrogenase/methenyltetrahydrofolate cyclohydrolase FolD [Armatimonadota bacterium]
MATILDGSLLAKTIRTELSGEVEALQKSSGVTPRLDVVIVGDDPGSVAYVNMKRKASMAIGMHSEVHQLPADASQEHVLDLVHSLGGSGKVHGILVQHPLPRHLDEQPILDAVLVNKDVDGISTLSLGRLIVGLPGFRPCTPEGMMRLLAHYAVPIEGRTAVIVGRSIILGKPMALMLLEKHATVTICHSRTKDLADICRHADILVAAVGRAEMIKASWIKPGACVLDAGYTRFEDGTHVGDVEFQATCEVASWITPVPGGVGPMTIAMLLENTIKAARRAAGA